MSDVTVAVVTAVATVAAGALGAFWSYKVNNKSILIKTVTEERAKWRNDLRSVFGEFTSLTYEQINNSNASNKPRIHELKSNIVLRVNYKKKHKLDNDIVRLCEIIVTGLDNGSSKEVVLRNLYLLEEKLQQLIKQEWDKSKEEAVTGKIERRKKIT
ncbi:hypothetical protein CGJ90_22560 [Vibrio parahaemolyticus]|uniref:hypothetical protein n=1 Tax=Vibrio parahaemolyticus TaxID=670 RepID=UPI00116D5F25|nr:hypothetical protein [Vibrio parahaemolyticus]TOC19898.1 hypothetical protein CGJ90_22560 [Vibrio parahaemolyticus]